MIGAHLKSVSPNLVDQAQGHAPGASTKSNSLQKRRWRAIGAEKRTFASYADQYNYVMSKRMIRFILLLTICFLASRAIAADEYKVNWLGLKSAFEAFLAQPDKSHCEKITILLPPGEIASSNVRNVDINVATQILNKLGEIEKLVNSGNEYALNVAFALGEISDGEYSEWIDEIISSAITTYPRQYLVGIKERRLSQPYPYRCLSAAVVNEGVEGDYVAILKKRLKAIKSVTDPELEPAKKCVSDVLNEYLSKPSLK
jgi:hypothetical protein